MRGGDKLLEQVNTVAKKAPTKELSDPNAFINLSLITLSFVSLSNSAWLIST